MDGTSEQRIQTKPKIKDFGPVPLSFEANRGQSASEVKFLAWDLAECHAGLDTALLEKRAIVYEAAKSRCPERWSGATRNWQPILVARLNPDQHIAEKDEKMEAVLEPKMAA